MQTRTDAADLVAQPVPLWRAKAYSYLEGSLETELMASAHDASLPHTGHVWVTHNPATVITPELLIAALPDGGVLTRTFTHEENLVVFVRGPGFAAKIDCSAPVVDLEFAASTYEAATALAKAFKAALDYTPPRDELVRLRVWGGGEVLYRDHKEPVDWSQIATNYSAPTRDALCSLMAHTESSPRSGKIILWHGEPGTGKSWALRSLMSAWNNWCEADLILDPEFAFASPNYVAQLLKAQGPVKNRLLICEDADSLVSSREGREGRLERILNMADGIVGQGSNTMILITTNAGPDRLDPAVSRPGRCFANIHFSRFSVEEAKERVQCSGIEVTTAMTLAETYNLSRPNQQIRQTARERKVGQYL